ncbi:ANK3 [Symbiodinium sp. CCMP2456]|nr:ANK3 [Symbiodinium sp. CCMP2456]
MAQPRRSFFLCDGNPVGAELKELNVWLTEANFQGQSGSLHDLKEHLRMVQKWAEDLVLFVALPKHLAASRDSVESFINVRAGSSLCVIVIFAESKSDSPDPSINLNFQSNEILPEKMNRKDKWQAEKLLPYRHSKAEFGYLVVSDLGRLLCLWRRLQATQCHDLSSLLDEASREEHVLEHLETTAMTSFTSLAVTFSDSCGACSNLEDAVRMGHLTCLQNLLVNGRGRGPASEEFSPLHLAVLKAGQRKGKVFVKMAKLLLAAKHDAGLQTSHGITPLHWAAGYGLSALTWTMLHLSGTGELTWVAKTDPYDAKNLEKMGRLANLPDRRGRTALYRAVMHGHEECVRWLTQMGADCNLSDANHCSPLHAALQQNPRVALVTTLLKARAAVNSADADGRLPLHLLASHRTHSDDLLERLLPSDAVTECRDRDGWTPLHEAALSGNAKLLEQLLLRAHAHEKALPGVLSIRDSTVPHILHVAIMAKSSECVELLLNSRASPLETACLTWDAEHFRIQRHYTEVGLCLMNSGVLAAPFDRILFKTDLHADEFQRNVGEKLRELQRNYDRSELKVLHTRELTREQCEIILAEAQRLGMRCIPPGDFKEDGSRQTLSFGSECEAACMGEMDPGAECCFYDMSDFQRRLVHEVARDLGVHSRSEGQAVRVRKALEQASKRPRVEKDEDFLEELRGDLDSLKEGDAMHLGYGLSSYRRKKLHEEVERRGWSSKSDGSSICVRHVAPTEHLDVTHPKLKEDEVKERVRRQLELLGPGESCTFPASLNSFERRIVHQVAEELGWVSQPV